MRKKTVILKWTRRIRFEKAYEKEISHKQGIYYISRVFAGREKLLYIGKTIDSFSHRMRSHEKNWLHEYRGRKYIRFGTLLWPRKYDNDLIEDIESAIIFEVNPVCNQMKTKHYTYRSKYFVRLHNMGFRGELPKYVDARLQAEE